MAVTETIPTGNVVVYASGSTLTLSGSFGGTPTGGTLNLSNLTLTLPAVSALTLNGAISYTSPPANTRALTEQLLEQVFADTNIIDFAPLNGVWFSAGTAASFGFDQVTVISGSSSSSLNEVGVSVGQWLGVPGTSILGTVYFPQPISLTWRFSFNNALSTNAILRCLIGKSSGTGALGENGFGFGVIYKTASTGSVIAYTYDGTLHTSGELAVIPTGANSVVTMVKCTSDGAGNLYVYVNGAYVGTQTGAPTTANTDGKLFTIEISNNADAIDNRVTFSAIRAVVKKS